MDNMAFHKKAWEAFFEKYRPTGMSLEDFLQYFGRTNKDLLTILYRGGISEDQMVLLGEEKETLYRQIYARHIEPAPGLVGFLEVLKQNGVRMAVASAAPKVNVDFVFEHIPIRDYFAAVIDADDVTRGKPDPEIYLKAASLIRVKPQHCVVFEDSLNGIKAAKQAGAKVIGVTTTHPAEALEGIDMFIGDFTEISLETLSGLIPYM